MPYSKVNFQKNAILLILGSFPKIDPKRGPKGGKKGVKKGVFYPKIPTFEYKKRVIFHQKRTPLSTRIRAGLKSTLFERRLFLFLKHDFC